MEADRRPEPELGGMRQGPAQPAELPAGSEWVGAWLDYVGLLCWTGGHEAPHDGTLRALVRRAHTHFS